MVWAICLLTDNHLKHTRADGTCVSKPGVWLDSLSHRFLTWLFVSVFSNHIASTCHVQTTVFGSDRYRDKQTCPLPSRSLYPSEWHRKLQERYVQRDLGVQRGQPPTRAKVWKDQELALGDSTPALCLTEGAPACQLRGQGIPERGKNTSHRQSHGNMYAMSFLNHRIQSIRFKSAWVSLKVLRPLPTISKMEGHWCTKMYLRT